jgi:hypothetical protein
VADLICLSGAGDNEVSTLRKNRVKISRLVTRTTDDYEIADGHDANSFKKATKGRMGNAGSI